MNAREFRQPRFFLTRQSANLIEDLDRQLTIAGSICLLYGRSGVGKTSLLEYFCSRRSAGRKVVFIRLDGQDGSFRLEDGVSRYPVEDLQKVVFDLLESGGLLIVDGLENADDSLLRGLLRFIEQQSTAADVRVILSTDSRGLGEIHSLSQEFHLRISSVELKPLGQQESEDFLDSLLCPEWDSSLALNRGQRRRIKSASGSFPALVTMASEWRGDVDCNKAVVPKPRAGYLWLILLAATVLAALVVNRLPFPLSGNSNDDGAQSLDSLNISLEPALVKTPSQRLKPASQPGDTPMTTSGAAEAMGSVESGQGSKVRQQVSEMTQQAPAKASEVSDSDTIEATGDNVPSSNVPQSGSGATAVAQNEQQTLLQSRLVATQKWLEQAPNRTGSIQVMTLVFNKRSVGELGEFLNELSTQGVNLNEIYIYQLKRNNGLVYGVLYGSYPNLTKASAAIADLPEIFKSNKPYPRSVIGIKREIEKIAS